jgi:hypothetical protein
METWNREELYKEIWEQPMLKLAHKYGISSVMRHMSAGMYECISFILKGLYLDTVKRHGYID